MIIQAEFQTEHPLISTSPLLTLFERLRYQKKEQCRQGHGCR